MSDELLRKAAESLRTSTDGASERAAETRARLLAGARRGRTRRSRFVVAVLPIAAALAVSGAWAAATGRMTAAWHAVEAAGQPEQAAHRSEIRTSVNVARSRSASVDLPAPEVLSAPPVVASSPIAAAAPGVSSSRAAASASQPVPSDADHLAYVAAHRTHFGGADPATALRGWDAYLRAYPSGRFSLEARYNRALCLVKLGRNAEATQALEPFARGAYGTYRQVEAKALLDALSPP